MNVLSVFDGMSCGQIALERAGIKVDNYFSCEINHPAIKVTMINYPETIQLGDICKIKSTVICSSGVYGYICLKYFNNDLSNLQSIISEREMLYRINQEQTFAAYFGTQKPNESKEVSENSVLSINDSIWFFKPQMGNNKGIFDIIKGGGRRKVSNTIDVSELCKHSFWWNGNRQSEFRTEKKSIMGIKGEKKITRNEREIKTSSDKTILFGRIEARSIQENTDSNERPYNEAELLVGNEENKQRKLREEKIRNREEEEFNSVSKIDGQLYNRNDNERSSEKNKNIIPIHKETQVTLVECEWGVIFFNGLFSIIQGGSPCQDISNLSKFRLGLDGSKSSLFFQYWRMWQETKPKWFLLENVAGNKSAIDKITKLMGVRPLKLNSNLVSPQNRKRLYWTNIPVNSLPDPCKIQLSEILQKEEDVDDKYYQSEGWMKWWVKNQDFQLSKSYSTLNAEKAGCLTKRMYSSWNGNFIKTDRGIRRLTPIECERLQTVPDNYTSIVSDNARYEMLGNGWTVDIITHILKHI